MKKSAYFVVLATAAVAISLLSSFAVSHVDMLRLSKAANAYAINAFDFAKLNPSTNVVLSTNNNNSINMTTSGLSVSGNKLILAPGGYLEVARNDELPFKNAINGLTSIETDMVGRIEYSYLDQLYIVDDALAGPFSFPADVKPSFFKLYNDDENPVEISSLLINYSCEETTSSVIAGAGAYTLANGVATSTATNTTFTIPIEARRGIVSYKVLIPNESTESFAGVVVGLNYTDEHWWEKTDENPVSYMFSAISGAGKGAWASMSANYGWSWCDGTVSRHTVHTFSSQEFNDFEITFDCNNNIYSLYQSNQLVAAAKTSRSITGNKFGVRFGNAVGMQIKDIKITLNKDFVAEQPHKFSNGSNDGFYIHREDGSNVYQTSLNNAIMWWTREIPTTGTITWDHTADSPCTFYNEGLAFSSNSGASATGSGENMIAIIGSANTNTSFSMSGRYFNITDNKYEQGWMSNRLKINYLSDNTTLHLKMEYDLENITFKLYYRATENDDWTFHYTFSNDNTTRNYAGMKFLGIRAGYTHNNTDGLFTLTISNLVVNGVAW